MLAVVDVDYRDSQAWAACLVFDTWAAADASATFVEHIPSVHPYVPGQFFRRELPCLLAVLARAPAMPEVIVVDGYVWLGAERRPGLGAHLYEALGGTSAVIGVAKSPFVDTMALPVVRGHSRRPLWVTAAGIDEQEAARCIQQMHGTVRIPTLIKAVDRACRSSW